MNLFSIIQLIYIISNIDTIHSLHIKALRRLERTSRVGTGAELEGHALGFMPPKHPLRKFLFNHLYSQYPCD